METRIAAQARQGLFQRLGIAAIIAVGGVFIWRSLVDLPLGTITDPGPAAAPLLLASLVILCALWSMFSGAAGLLATGTEDDGTGEPQGMRQAALIAVVTILAAGALGTLGYRLTILATLLFFLGPVERKPFVTVLVVSFAMSFGSYWLFDRVLKVTLPTGPFGL